MNGMGLAGTPTMGQQTEPMRDLDQIVAMLMQGVNPDELIAQGIPQELVAQAMQIVAQEMGPQTDGLAGMHLPMGT